jgi:TonB family protein
MSPANRTRSAFAVSTAAHLAVLAALVLTVERMPVRNPLVVRLLQLPPVEAVAGSAPEDARASGPSGLPARVLGERASSERGAAMARRRLAAPGPTVAAAPPAEPGSGVELAGDATGAAEPQPPGGSGEGEGAHGATAADGVPGRGGGGGDSQLAELHRRLADAAARCYPAAALRLRLQGVVPLHFCLDERGAASALSLEGSTGSLLLDRSALECVVPGAAPLPGVVGCFRVPVRFGG